MIWLCFYLCIVNGQQFFDISGPMTRVDYGDFQDFADVDEVGANYDMWGDPRCHLQGEVLVLREKKKGSSE